MPSTALTPRQQRFVDEYLIDLNATQAAIRAGYSEKTARAIGCENLTKPNIAEAITAGKAVLSKRTGVSQDWVIGMLRKNVRRAMQAEEIRDSLGHPTGVYRYEGAVANGALNLLGKHLGLFPDRQEHTGANGGPLTVQVVYSRE